MESKLKKFNNIVDKFFSAVSKSCEVISIIALVCIMIMLMAQTVLMWFSVSILWSDEFVSVMNIWLVFMAATVVSHEKKHVQVDFVTNALPKVVQSVLAILMEVLSLIACAYVFKGGILYIQGTQNIVTNILKLPMITLYAAPIVALGLMMLMNIVDICRGIAMLFCRKSTEIVEGGEAQ